MPRADNHDELVEGFLADLRTLGKDMTATAYAYWFSSGILFFDEHGKIMEAGADTD